MSVQGSARPPAGVPSGLSHSTSAPSIPPSTSLSTDRANLYSQVRDIRLGFHKSMTPLGEVFHHTGTFTPMEDMYAQGREAGKAGERGPWRSVGTWWQSLQAEEEERENVYHEDQVATRYWPLGKSVIKMHGSLEPEHFFLGHRKKSSKEAKSSSSSGGSRWLVKNCYVEKLLDRPMGRTFK